MKTKEIRTKRDNKTGKVDRYTTIRDDGKNFFSPGPSVREIHERVTPGPLWDKTERLRDVTKSKTRS